MVSTDLSGVAIQLACKKLNERLQPLREQHPKMNFEQIAELAYEEGIDLSATASKSLPRLVFDWRQYQGDVSPSQCCDWCHLTYCTQISYFFVWGAALALVEVDIFTGWSMAMLPLVELK